MCDCVDDGRKVKVKKVFNYTDLVKCEFSENHQLVGSASFGGAAVGGLVGGATGAIIGSSVGKTKKNYTCQIILFFNDFENPSIMIAEDMPVNSLYKDIIEGVKKQRRTLYGLCEYVINQNNMNA